MPTAPRRPWTRDELLLALHLYQRIPFGQQHARSPAVVALAARLGRTAGSVAMKLNNFTSLDPVEAARGVKGLAGASALDRAVWDAAAAEPLAVFAEAEALWAGERPAPSPAPKPAGGGPPAVLYEPMSNYHSGPPAAQEAEAVRTVRLAQGYFRRVVLDNFGGRCALTGLAHPGMVNASHVVGWAEDPLHRVNPRNGIALNRLHDAAFDQHLITFDERLRLVVGRALRDRLGASELAAGFLVLEGRALPAGLRHALDPALLARHREGFVALAG